MSQAALDQVHQQEGEIVEHVAGGDPGIEFDGIEQHRLSFEQHDIAEMQIAVTAPHEPCALARIEQRTQPRQRGACRVAERAHLIGRE